MTPIVLGQLLGVSFACGLNLYLTVATIGILSRFDVLTDLPPGLQGLEGHIVIASALALYLVEAVIDKIRHADSLWDTIHTFIRPPAAALLAAGALWGAAPLLIAAGTALAFLVAMLAHGTKAGFRLAVNATMSRGQPWYSLSEDVLAVAFAVTALVRPVTAAFATGAVLLVMLLIGPRFWRAFHLGFRCLAAWLRAFFAPPRLRDFDELPRGIRDLLGPTPMAAAPPRGARAAVHGLPGAGAYRNGWLIFDSDGVMFAGWTLLGYRTVELPSVEGIRVEPGVWADMLRVHPPHARPYTLYLLKDGPPVDVTVQHLSQATA